MNNDKAMFRSMHLKKESDDGEYILNQIEKEINQDVVETKERLENIEGECIRLDAEWKSKDELYKETLKEENQRKLSQLRFGSFSKKE